MIDQNDIMCHVRESFSGLRMDVPVEDLFARSRVHRRRRLTGLTTAAAAAAVAATAMTLSLGGPAPARSGSPPPASSTGPVRLVAFSVTNGPGDSTTLVLHKGPQYPPLDPSALRRALARHGIPALVTVGTFCRSMPGANGFGQVVHPATLPGGSDAIVISGQAMPPGTELSIGLFPRYTRMLLIKNHAPLTCDSTSHQPAVHTTPTGTPVRGSQSGSQK